MEDGWTETARQAWLIGKGPEDWETGLFAEDRQSRSLLQPSDGRSSRLGLVEEQGDDGDLIPTECIDRQQRMIDASQSRPPHHDHWQPERSDQVNHTDGRRDWHSDPSDPFDHHAIVSVC